MSGRREAVGWSVGRMGTTEVVNTVARTREGVRAFFAPLSGVGSGAIDSGGYQCNGCGMCRENRGACMILRNQSQDLPIK